MRGPGLFDNYCSCSDFAVNTIGKCKHVEALLRRMGRRHGKVDGAKTSTQTLETSARPSEPWRMPAPTDLIFPKWQRELFKTILDKEGLRFDREGRPRTAYGTPTSAYA